MSEKKYIFNDSLVTDPKKRMYIRQNNGYLLTVINQLVIYDCDLSNFKKDNPSLLARAISGDLVFSDEKTGVSTGDLANKVKFLITELDSNPEAKEIFKRSLFAKAFHKLFAGDGSYKWHNYKFKEEELQHMPEYIKKNPNAYKVSLNGATNIYMRESDKIGLDMAKVIDSIVKTDIDGHYQIMPTEEQSLKDSEQLMEAIDVQAKILKGLPTFQACYNKIERENDDDEAERE